MNDNLARVHLKISGRVQGVSFRAYTQEEARNIGVTGWVRNIPDGRVEAVFEGNESQIEEMLDWCHTGPPLARVQDVDVQRESYQGTFDDFKIRF